jgi:hypothetical protein
MKFKLPKWMLSDPDPGLAERKALEKTLISLFDEMMVVSFPEESVAQSWNNKILEQGPATMAHFALWGLKSEVITTKAIVGLDKLVITLLDIHRMPIQPDGEKFFEDEVEFLVSSIIKMHIVVDQEKS